ncbi:hypothetical protein CBL_00892 [Carabus blaptoides fortunei]
MSEDRNTSHTSDVALSTCRETMIRPMAKREDIWSSVLVGKKLSGWSKCQILRLHAAWRYDSSRHVSMSAKSCAPGGESPRLGLQTQRLEYYLVKHRRLQQYIKEESLGHGHGHDVDPCASNHLPRDGLIIRIKEDLWHLTWIGGEIADVWRAINKQRTTKHTIEEPNKINKSENARMQWVCSRRIWEGRKLSGTDIRVSSRDREADTMPGVVNICEQVELINEINTAEEHRYK